ncbi:MAG: cupin domain-containing protein [Actinomycetota bacterium]|nr:cupin domain-containing protein [Actinomycetota bacterium]
MAGIVTKSFDSPDETRTPEKTNVAVVKLGKVSAGRLTAQPGWSWSECIKPVVGTDSCQALHIGAVQSGRLHIKHDDGTEAEVGPGDAYVIEPGHDAWVLGDEAFVAFEFESKTAEGYAT